MIELDVMEVELDSLNEEIEVTECAIEVLIELRGNAVVSAYDQAISKHKLELADLLRRKDEMTGGM